MDHFLALDGLPLSLGSLKRAEEGEGLILRLHEPYGNRGRATLRFPIPLNRIDRVNLLELEELAEGPAPVLADDEATVHLDVRPFEVVSLRVVLSN
jgi:alpha-mannosidase